jgi:hypothetical protein
MRCNDEYGQFPTGSRQESRTTDLPDGLFRHSAVQPLCKKFPALPIPRNTFITPHRPPHEGRIAIVTDAGLDAMDAGGAADESAHLVDGEVVWS